MRTQLTFSDNLLEIISISILFISFQFSFCGHNALFIEFKFKPFLLISNAVFI